MLMLDLDHFKRINDSLGHHVGDEVLKQVAVRIKGLIRDSDTIARMGGDEFVVVLGRISNPYEAQFLASTLIERIREPVSVGANELIVSPSIGISVYPEHGENVTALMKNADSAMYMAKQAGRSTHAIFNVEMAQRAQLKIMLESALGRVIKNNDLKLYYQPQICTEKGTVVAMEALLRWSDPMLGSVPPDQFVRVAEECGLIVAIGEWVLRKACQDAQALQARTGNPIRLAVNLSACQLYHANLLPVIQSALADSGFKAECLEIEITESVLMDHTPGTVQRLDDIRALGASIAIDDFGVGFSSFSYISQFKIDTLKIDRSFVAKIPDSVVDCAVAQSIISLAKNLGIKVVAEGVETEQQLDFLRDQGCTLVQGNLTGAAVPIAKLSLERRPLLSREALS